MATTRASVDARRAEISDLVAERGFVRIEELVQHFGVTSMTIHRDLDELTNRGLLTKVRSGARATPIEEIERNVAFREHHMTEQKRAIAAAAASWLNSQNGIRVVAVDDSTTALATVEHLMARPEITVVTNFRRAIDRIADEEGSSLIAVGGTYAHEFQSFHGPSAIEAIRSVQIDVAFVSAASVWSGAVYHPSEVPLLTKRAFLMQAEQSVLVIDHTKFSRRAMHRQARLEEFDVVVVDDEIEPAHLRELQESVPTVIIA